MEFMYQMIETLGYLQNIGMSHRNIKPQTILVDRKPNKVTYKMADFYDAMLITPKKL